MKWWERLFFLSRDEVDRVVVEQAFLDEIEAHPHDDVRKLVYADWLDEQGDPLGAVIRLSCELRQRLQECRGDKRAKRLGISLLLIDAGTRTRMYSLDAGVEALATVLELPSAEQPFFETEGPNGQIRRVAMGPHIVTIRLGEMLTVP